MIAKRLVVLLASVVFVIASASLAVAADSPTAVQGLGFTPTQSDVEYDKVGKEEAAQCTIRPEKENNVTAWVVRNKQGDILRRFADTNGDNVVDQWCYFSGGLEVYRDIDSNFNGKADQYRWFNTGGTRWGVDKNEDGRIDAWRAITPHEVAEQVVLAIKTRDAGRFSLVLLTSSELGGLGLGQARADSIAEKLKAAPAAFSKLVAEQKTVSQQSRFADFGSARPARIPIGTGGSTQELIVLENASALIDTAGKTDQVLLGALVSVGDTWKLIDVPTVGSDTQQPSVLLESPLAGTSDRIPPGNGPSDEMQKLLAQLEQLDKQNDTLPPEKQAANVEQRAELLRRIAETAPEADRDQWYRQLAGMLGLAAQSGNFPQGIERLTQLQKSLADSGANEDLVAAVEFQRMLAEYMANLNQPGSDGGKVEEKWQADLKAFVEQHPKSLESAEALLQLGIHQEFAGKADDAAKSYQKLVSSFPKAAPAAKATGALRRLTSAGKPIQLRGNAIGGGKIDLSAAPYKGKVVLIQYWATWCEPCKKDMVLLKDVYAKHASSRDFEILGVCLDDSPAPAKAYLAENRVPWNHIQDGGLDGRLANEMGVMTLPLMMLVDQNGNLVQQNIHLGNELDAELTRLIHPTTGTATTGKNQTRRR